MAVFAHSGARNRKRAGGPNPFASAADSWYILRTARSARPGCVEVIMGQTPHVNVTCEYTLFLRLFVSNGGGW
jgi:hypothetical protein